VSEPTVPSFRPLHPPPGSTPSPAGEAPDAAVRRAGSQSLDSVLATLPEPVLGASAPGAGGAAVGLLDPALLLMVLQMELRDAGMASATLQLEQGAQRSEVAHTERQEALARAEEAGRRARRLLHRAPRWVRKLVSGVVAAVGVVAAAYTGGASLGLAIAGATLLLAGDAIAKGLERAGLDPASARWVAVGLRVAGTVLSAASGVGAADALPSALGAADTVAEVVDASTQALEGSQHVAQSLLLGRSERALLEADAAADRFEEAQEDAEEAMRGLGDVATVLRRASERASKIAAAAEDARLAAIAQVV